MLGDAPSDTHCRRGAEHESKALILGRNMGSRFIRGSTWKEAYRIALLETDPGMVRHRIAAAHRAILERIVEVYCEPPRSEYRELVTALHYLSMLENKPHEEYQQHSPGTS